MLIYNLQEHSSAQLVTETVEDFSEIPKALASW